MTLINRMIKQAKAETPPAELTIRPKDVNRVADHILGSQGLPPDIWRERVRAYLRAGGIKLLGVPIRVISDA